MTRYRSERGDALTRTDAPNARTLAPLAPPRTVEVAPGSDLAAMLAAVGCVGAPADRGDATPPRSTGADLEREAMDRLRRSTAEAYLGPSDADNATDDDAPPANRASGRVLTEQEAERALRERTESAWLRSTEDE